MTSRFLRHAAMLVVPMLVLGGSSGLAADGAHEYIGTKKCRVCHLKEYNSWAKTKMGMAFEVLKPGENAAAKKAAGLDPAKDYTKEAECLACHTVGYGKPGGFKDIETTPDRAGVGCEMCHGAGGTYTQSQHMSLQNKEYRKADVVAAGLVGEIKEENCTQVCHNEKSPFVKEGYVFDFAARRNQGLHELFPLKYSH